MAYTPELTKAASCTLRRLAWAAGLPMTKTMNRLFKLLPALFDQKLVCDSCRDKSKCSICGFSDIVKQVDTPCPVQKSKIRKKNPVREFNLEYPPDRENHSEGGITEDDLLHYAQRC